MVVGGVSQDVIHVTAWPGVLLVTLGATVHTGGATQLVPFHKVPTGHAQLVFGIHGPKIGLIESAQKVRVSMVEGICPPVHTPVPPGPTTRVCANGEQVSVMVRHAPEESIVEAPAAPHGPQKPAGRLFGGM